MQSSLFEQKNKNNSNEKIIFLDTEATDNTEDSRLTQLAFKNLNTNEIFSEYFKPPVPVSISAMSVTHITNKMLEDKPVFDGSIYKEKLISILDDHIMISHNAPFDIMILRNEGVFVKRSIDTLRVARHLIESESYKLQYLRYLLDLDIQVGAHNALFDVLVLEKLFYHLEDLMKVKFAIENRQDIISKMIELTSLPVLIALMKFGKYRGKTFEEIKKLDLPYLEWLYSSEISKPEHEQNEDLLYTISQTLK